jgi:hypothetical protein
VHSVNFAAKLVHTKRALSNTVIRSRVQANPATLLIPIDFSFPFRGGGALRYSVPKWLLFSIMWGVVFTACVVFFFFSQLLILRTDQERLK